MPPEPKLVGIINVTPDSFSDGGGFHTAEDALAAIGRLVDDGAAVIDIGAESTRPGAAPVAPEEEWRRLAPVLAGISRFSGTGVEFSVDTRHPATAKQALAAGVHWINDVSGFSDPAMVETVRDSACKLVVMHSLTVPADKSVVMDEARDSVSAIIEFAHGRLAALEAAGIGRSRLIFDPGIGFGKNKEQSLSIIRRFKEFSALGVPLYVGHSRKSFLSGMPGNPDPDEATAGLSCYLARQGAAYLRVHDVKRNRIALKGLLHRLEDYGI